MIETIRKSITAPKFENAGDNQRAAILNGFTLTLLPLLLVSTVVYIITGYANDTLTVFIGLMVTTLFSQILLRFRRLTLAGIVMVVAGYALVTFQAYTAEGVRDAIIFGYIALTFLSTLLLNWRSAMFVVIASIGAIWFVAFAEIQGSIQPSPKPPLGYARDVTTILLVIAALVFFVTRNLRNALESARLATQQLEASNAALDSLRVGLENQVNERTQELARASERFEERAKKYEAIALVARNISSIEDIRQLLSSISTTINYQLGYYHVAVFLVDDDHKYAELKASNSVGGESLLMRGHRLEVGGGSIVGDVAATGRTRIAFDRGAEAITFAYPDLPETRSEIALPLRNGETILGVLDVHSDQPEAFNAADVEILTTLSAQVASAITNAILLEKARQGQAAAELAYRQYVKQEWSQFIEKLESPGFRYAMNRVEPITDAGESEQVGTSSEVIIPVVLRGETLGEISIDTQGRPWTTEDYALIRSAAERAALGLENARLINSTRQRAQVERTIADISATIGSSTDFDSIMRATVEELGKVINMPEIYIKIHKNEP